MVEEEIKKSKDYNKIYKLFKYLFKKTNLSCAKLKKIMLNFLPYDWRQLSAKLTKLSLGSASKVGFTLKIPLCDLGSRQFYYNSQN